MKRRFLKVLPVILAAVLALSGCGGGGDGGSADVAEDKTLYEKIKNTLTTMETYEAVATVRYMSNNSSNAYRTKQQCRMTGEYRVEILEPEDAAGNITVFNGKTITQYNTKINGKVAVGSTETAERSEIFLTSFIRNHLAASQEVTIAVSSNADEDEMTFLEAKVPGNNPYLATERLVIMNDTMLPKELVIYDEEGKERIVVTYHEIEYNIKLEDPLFTYEF